MVYTRKLEMNLCANTSKFLEKNKETTKIKNAIMNKVEKIIKIRKQTADKEVEILASR